MAFTSYTPTAPWVTGVSGSGTWAELVTFINNPAIITKVGDVYTVYGQIEIAAVMTALLNSIIINKGGGGWSITVGGAVTLGRSITTPSGVALAVDGCTVIDDVDCFQRGFDNYLNNKAWLRNGGYLTMYASNYYNKNAGTLTTQRSDLDFQSGGNLKIRDCRFHLDAGADCFDHYAGNLDIDGLVTTHASDTGGALLEIMTTSVITKLNNMTPYLNNATSRQCTLWAGNVTLSQWGGDNFAPWDLAGYYRLDDPKVMSLIYVDRYGTGGASFAERRTTDFLCLDTAGPVTATVTAINNVDEVDGEGVASGTTGIYTAKLKRKTFAAGLGGATAPSGYTRTPHVIYARKWGYKTYSSTFAANPTAYAQTRLTDVVAMTPDTNITLTSAASAAISGVTITKHGKAVNWNGKDFSLTIQAPNTLTLDQVYHSVAYQCSELTTLMPRAAARAVSGNGHQYVTPWTGANGDSDLTLVIVHTSRPNDKIFAQQIAGSIGTATNGLSLRTHLNRGCVFQNYTNDLFPDGSYTGAQQQFNNPDGGDQLLISVGRYNSVTKQVTVWTNNKNYATETQTINRGTVAQFFRIAGQGDTMSWEVEQHIICESMGFDRRLSDTEVSDLTKYLANKWHHTAVGNIVPSAGNDITSANYPVNGSGVDWTPSDYTSGQGPKHWISMADPADYTVSGSNITAFKDKITGLNITNSGWASLQLVSNFRKFVAHQMFDTKTTTARAVYPDGRYRGVRVIDQYGNPFQGMDKMMADDGTYYIPPVTLTITASVSLVGAEVRIYDLDSGAFGSYGTELAGVESCPSSTFSYTGTQGNTILVQILLPDYLEFTQQMVIPNANSTFYATMTVDNTD